MQLAEHESVVTVVLALRVRVHLGNVGHADARELVLSSNG